MSDKEIRDMINDINKYSAVNMDIPKELQDRADNYNRYEKNQERLNSL